MTRDILSVSKNETDVERLFNQKRDIIHYRRIRLNAKTIKTLMMIRMHANRKKKLTTKSDTLNCENMKDRAKNHKNFEIYSNVELYSSSEIFEDDSISNNLNKEMTANENDYTFFSDENFDREMNDLIDRTCTQQAMCTQQAKVLAKKSESSIQKKNEKRRRKHQLSIDASNKKRRI